MNIKEKMNKVIFKESDKKFIIIDILFNIILCLIGLCVLKTTGIEYIKVLRYFYLIFYVVAFFSLIAYFSNRRKGDYELLYFAFINVYVGSFALIYRDYQNSYFILGCSVLIYTIANLYNRGVRINTLNNEKNLEFFPKLFVTLVLTLFCLGISFFLYQGNAVEFLIVGYFFLTFGLLSLLEPMLTIIMKNDKVMKFVVDKKASEPVKSVVKRQVKKPVKVTVEEPKKVVRKRTTKKKEENI